MNTDLSYNNNIMEHKSHGFNVKRVNLHAENQYVK